MVNFELNDLHTFTLLISSFRGFNDGRYDVLTKLKVKNISL